MPGVWTWGFTEGWSQVYADSVGHQPQRDRRAATRPSATPPPRRSSGGSTRSTSALRGQAGHGDGLVPLGAAARRSRSSGRCATTRTTWRRASSRRSSTPPATAPTCSATSGGAAANAVEKGATETPYAIALPEKQRDRTRLAASSTSCATHGIEVSRARQAFTVEGGDLPGRHVPRPARPALRGYAMDLLLPQKYPIEKATCDAVRRRRLGAAVDASASSRRPIEDEAVKPVKVELVTAPTSRTG